MKAESVTFGTIFSNGGKIHYGLPYFQREYAWGRDEWNELLNDLEEVYTQRLLAEEQNHATQSVEHFLGSLVIVDDGLVLGTLPTLSVVDGQQRLTTISLLLCALRDLTSDDNEALSEIIEEYLTNGSAKGDYRYKIYPTTKYGDRDAYKALIDHKKLPEVPSNIPLAYDYLFNETKTRLQNGLWKPETLFALLMQSLSLVMINLKRDENPYKIFESLNAKGKPLTQADLVRNFIAMTLPTGSQETVFCDHWSQIESLLQEKRIVGRSEVGELSAFLRHYLAINSGVLFNQNRIYARFRNRALAEFPNAPEFIEELARLHDYARIYARLLRPEGHPNPKIKRVLQRLGVLDISTAYSFLMGVFYGLEQGDYSEEEVLETLNLLENYLMRRFLAGQPTNYLNKMFPQLWLEIKDVSLVEGVKEALKTRRYPTDHEIRNSLEKRDFYGRGSAALREQLIFILMEINQSLSQHSDVVVVLKDHATIEHILPQTPSDEWKHGLGVEDILVRDGLKHTLGNLTLVTQSFNSELSNKSFELKKQKLAEHGLHLNSHYFTEEVTCWDRDAITQRTNALIEQILQIWNQKIEIAMPVADTPLFGGSWYKSMMQRVSNHLSLSLNRLTNNLYETADGTVHVACVTSNQWQQDDYHYSWFKFYASEWKSFLGNAEQTYIGLMSGSPDKIVLIPYADFLRLTHTIPLTQKGNLSLYVYEENRLFFMGQPRYETKTDITDWLIKTS